MCKIAPEAIPIRLIPPLCPPSPIEDYEPETTPPNVLSMSIQIWVMCRSHVLAQMQTLLSRFIAPNLRISNSECGVRLPVASTQLLRHGKRYSFASRKKSFIE